MTSPQVTGPEPPAGLGARGLRLWAEWITPECRLGPGHLVLVAEAARCADRLERLDAILRGDGREWLRFVGDLAEDGADVRVVVDGALVEARQQQLALRALVAEIRQALAPPKAGAPPAPAGDSPKEDPLATVLSLVVPRPGR